MQQNMNEGQNTEEWIVNTGPQSKYAYPRAKDRPYTSNG